MVELKVRAVLSLLAVNLAAEAAHALNISLKIKSNGNILPSRMTVSTSRDKHVYAARCGNSLILDLGEWEPD